MSQRDFQVLVGKGLVEVQDAVTAVCENASRQVGPHGATTVVVDPTHVSVVAGLLTRHGVGEVAEVVAVVGYPTGRHHTLIKASEARLAFQSGAKELWISVDGTVEDMNAHVADLVAIREACPQPARLGLLVPQSAPPAGAAVTSYPSSATSAMQAAALAGFDSLVTPGRGAATTIPDQLVYSMVVEEVPGLF